MSEFRSPLISPQQTQLILHSDDSKGALWACALSGRPLSLCQVSQVSAMNLKKIIWYTLTVSVVCTLFVLTPYVYFMGPQGISSDHQAWASFGGYIGGVLGPLLSFANLLAVAWIGTAVVSKQQEYLIRKQLSVDLISEYHAEPMHSTRIAIDEPIEVADRNGGALPSLSGFERTDPTNSPNAFRLYHFFEKWAVLAKTGNVDNTLLFAALGQRVAWWEEKFFRRITRRETNQHILASLKEIDSQVLSRARCQ